MRSVQLFVAAYEERSFTAAALREHATQSGVSQHIRRIENRFGVRLFDRVAGTVVPTAAGTRYYARCIELLRLGALAERELGDAAGALSGTITVGLMPTVCARALAPALAEVERLHPLVTVDVAEAYSHELVRRVRAGELDFAVVPAGSDVAGVRASRLVTVRELIVRRHDGADGAWAGVRAPIKIVLPGVLNVRHRTIVTYLRANDIPVARTMALDTMMGTLDLVERTDWVAILPELIFADRDHARFDAQPLRDPPLMLDLVCIEPASRPLSHAAGAFLALLRTSATALGARLHA